MAAANAAAEVVRLTNKPHGCRLKNKHAAATKIQSAYRGHLVSMNQILMQIISGISFEVQMHFVQARKALSALKGLVKLQAVIRGELVRRSVIKKLPSTTLLAEFRPQAHQKRVPSLLEYLNQTESRHSLSRKGGIKSEEMRVSCLYLLMINVDVDLSCFRFVVSFRGHGI